jgi:SNF2 family DNA or RNA helicase
MMEFFIYNLILLNVIFTYTFGRCIVFSEDILCAEDVAGYEQLTDEDYVKLAQRIHSSQDEIKKESQELEIRQAPKGFVGNLLPFQIEGLSWMYNQEVNIKHVRGGILADGK